MMPDRKLAVLSGEPPPAFMAGEQRRRQACFTSCLSLMIRAATSSLLKERGGGGGRGRTDSLGAVRVTMGHLSFCLPCDDVTWAL